MSDDKATFLSAKLDNLEAAASGMKDMITAVIKGESELKLRLQRLANRISTYAGDRESHAFKTMAVRVGESIEKLQDQRSALTARLEARCSNPLAAHIQEVKLMKTALKNRETVMARMISRRKALEKIRSRNPDERDKILKAQADFTGATEEANEENKRLNQEMEAFEKKKNSNLKLIMRELMHAQMSFSAKSLELWTECATVVEALEFDQGMEELNALLYPAGSAAAEDK